MKTLDLWEMLPGVPRLWIRVLEVLSSIQSGTKVTYRVDKRSKVDTRSRIEPTDEDNRSLGKHNQCRVSKDRDGTI